MKAIFYSDNSEGEGKCKKIAFLTFVFFALSGFAWGQSEIYDKKCTAIVQGQTAQFIFPLPEKKNWTWNKKETSQNVMEYSWQISLHRSEMPANYDFGIYHFKFHTDEATGSIKELIEVSQISVWDESHKIQENLIIEASVENERIIIKVLDKETFVKLFSSNPTIADCQVLTPYKELNFKSTAWIEFNK
jgi:hypothetical protein